MTCGNQQSPLHLSYGGVVRRRESMYRVSFSKRILGLPFTITSVSSNPPATRNGHFERLNSSSCGGVGFRTGGCGLTRQRSSHSAQCRDNQDRTIQQS